MMRLTEKPAKESKKKELMKQKKKKMTNDTLHYTLLGGQES